MREGFLKQFEASPLAHLRPPFPPIMDKGKMMTMTEDIAGFAATFSLKTVPKPSFCRKFARLFLTPLA